MHGHTADEAMLGQRSPGGQILGPFQEEIGFTPEQASGRAKKLYRSAQSKTYTRLRLEHDAVVLVGDSILKSRSSLTSSTPSPTISCQYNRQETILAVACQSPIRYNKMKKKNGDSAPAREKGLTIPDGHDEEERRPNTKTTAHCYRMHTRKNKS